MKQLLVLGMILCLWSQPVYADDNEADEWAVEAVAMVEGTSIVDMERFSDYSAPITRDLYGYLIYQLYEHLAGQAISTDMALSVDHKFNDLAYEGTDGFKGTDNLYLEALKGAGLIEGYPDGSYKPKDYITREEIMTLYVRLLEALGYAMSASDHVFADEASISAWSYDSVKKCYANGLVQGLGNNKLSPKGYATIQETFVVMSRILEDETFVTNQALQNDRAMAIVSDGRRTYAVAYDLYGRPVGIDQYEDYTFTKQLYTGPLGDDHIYLDDGQLYFFNDNHQLIVYNGTFKTTTFMTSHNLDQWFMNDGHLTYQVEGVWQVYDLSNKRSGTYTETAVSLFSLKDGHLSYEDQVIQEGVIDYGVIGDKIYYINQEGGLLAYNYKTGVEVAFGSGALRGVDVSWNYLIIEEETIAGMIVRRYLPLFAIDDYFS